VNGQCESISLITMKKNILILEQQKSSRCILVKMYVVPKQAHRFYLTFANVFYFHAQKSF